MAPHDATAHAVSIFLEGRHRDPKTWENLRSDVIARLGEDIGLYCLTRANDNILMWSHYGKNHEGQTFLGVLALQRLASDRGIVLHYTATVDGREVHAESSLLARGVHGGLCLWPVMSELPVVLPHVESSSTSDAGCLVRVIFSSGPREDTANFREEITLALHRDGKLSYAHAWGMPGGPFDDRSVCEMEPSET